MCIALRHKKLLRKSLWIYNSAGSGLSPYYLDAHLRRYVDIDSGGHGWLFLLPLKTETTVPMVPSAVPLN